MAELADALGLGPSTYGVGVQVPPRAPILSFDMNTDSLGGTHMKKAIYIILATILVCSMLAGCNSKETEAPSANEPAVQGEEMETPSTSEETTESTPSGGDITFQQLSEGIYYKGDDGNSFAQFIFSSQTTFIYSSGAHAGGADTVMGTYELKDNKITMKYTSAFVENAGEEKTLECEITAQDDQFLFKYLSGDGMDDYLSKPGDELTFKTGTVLDEL